MQWWDLIKDQVMEGLQELCFRGIYADDIEEILSDDHFLQDEYIKTIRVNYESAELTLQQLVDVFSLLTGESNVFIGAVKYRIKELIADQSLQRPVEIELEEEVA